MRHCRAGPDNPRYTIGTSPWIAGTRPAMTALWIAAPALSPHIPAIAETKILPTGGVHCSGEGAD